MVLTLELPDSIAQALSSPGETDLSRKALEALAIDGFREGKLSQYQVSQMLGMSRTETEDLLARQVDLYDYDPAELRLEADLLAASPGNKNHS